MESRSQRSRREKLARAQKGCEAGCRIRAREAGMEAKETRILVVEDDFDAADAVRTILESEGYQVATADSAAKAWEAIHATRPHLLLLDVMMPTRTEGFQFVW